MKPYNREKFSTFSASETRYVNIEISPGVFQPQLRTQTTLSDRLRYEENLLVYEDRHGDFKSPTPHSYLKMVRDYGHGTLHYQDGQESKDFSGPGIASLPDALDFNFDSAYNIALERLYSQIRAGVDLSVDLSQSGQVVRMVKAVTKLRRFARSLTDLPNTWLQYQYGWKPLVSTIYDSGLVLSRQLERRGLKSFTGRGSEVKSYQTSSRDENSRTIDDNLISCRCHISCSFNFDDNWHQTLSDYTSLNPVSIAWELLPYSFVVDWVYDVGSYLRQMETSLVFSNSFRSGYVTETGLQSVSRKRFINGLSGDDTVSGSGYAYRSSRFFRRYVINGTPTPRPPRLKANLGVERLTSAAALLSQVFRRSSF